MAQSVTFKVRLGSVVTAIAILIFSGIVVSCSNQHPYDEAVELIKEKKYDQAKEVLQKIPQDDASTTRAAVAILVCDMGALYQKGDYEQACDVLKKKGEKDSRSYYQLNVPPADPLFAHAATLAHLVAGEMVIKEVTEYIESVEADPEMYVILVRQCG